MSQRAAERARLLADGRAMLEAWGAPRGAEPGILDGLRGLVGRSRAGDLALAERLGEVASPASAELLDELENRAGDGLVRREVRRARYRLAQRGVVSSPRPAVPAPPAAARAGEPEGWMSAVSGDGDRLLWLVRQSPGGGLRQLVGVVNEPEGLRDAELFDVSRKRLRRLREQLAAEHDMRLVAVAWRYADFVLWEGHERARSAGRPGADLPRLRSRLLHEEPVPVRHPLYDHLDPEVLPGAGSEVADAAALWEEPELSGWVLAGETVQPFVEELQAVQESPLVLNRLQQQDRVEAVFAHAVSVLLEDGGRRYRRRLEDMGYYFWQTGRPEAARRAGAVAVELAKRPATEVAFLKTLVRLSVTLALERHLQAEAERQEGALVLPPERLKAPGPPPRRPGRS